MTPSEAKSDAATSATEAATSATEAATEATEAATDNQHRSPLCRSFVLASSLTVQKIRAGEPLARYKARLTLDLSLLELIKFLFLTLFTHLNDSFLRPVFCEAPGAPTQGGLRTFSGQLGGA